GLVRRRRASSTGRRALGHRSAGRRAREADQPRDAHLRYRDVVTGCRRVEDRGTASTPPGDRLCRYRAADRHCVEQWGRSERASNRLRSHHCQRGTYVPIRAAARSYREVLSTRGHGVGARDHGLSLLPEAAKQAVGGDGSLDPSSSRNLAYALGTLVFIVISQRVFRGFLATIGVLLSL